jgi:hypothetical protein
MGEYKPAVAGDDGCWYGAIFSGTGTITFGDGGGPYNAFIRMPSFTPAHGDIVSAATLTVTGIGSTALTVCNVRIYGNLSIDAVAPTSAAEGNALVKTTAYVDWTVPAFGSGVAYDSPDVSPILQEILDQAGWVSGKAIQWIIVNNGSTNSAYRDIYDCVTDIAKAVHLDETSSVPTINASIPITMSMPSTLMKGAYGDMEATLPFTMSMGGTLAVTTISASIAITASISGTIGTPPKISASIPLRLSVGSTMTYFMNATGEAPYIILPAITISGEGFDETIGIGVFSLPSLTITAEGILDVSGDGLLTLPLLSITGIGTPNNIGSALIDLPRLTLLAEGQINEIGTANITLPMMTLVAEALSGIIGSFDKSIPPISISATGIMSIEGSASITLPSLVITGSSLAVVANYLSMVMNIKNKALTLYDNYDFNSMCQFNGKSFGATSTKIVDLSTGTTDDGTIIDWNFRTGYLDLEQRFKKKLKQVWFSYKSSGDIILTVIQPDGEEYEYSLEGIYITETGVRVKIGKGIRSKYVALDIKNVDGSTLTLDALKLHLDKVMKER